MAEGGTIPSLSFEEDMLCCSVCMEEYEDPRALPCLHTFCYKCLVQINESSDISKRYFLKCPLCAELHQIPKENGVAGFRKDFRIKNLIDQNEIKNPVAVSCWIPRDVSQEEIISPDVDSESCSIHPGERLLYFCESSSCQMDICEKCWSCDHDTHIVKLLSRKVNDAKDVVQQHMDKTIQKINSQIDILINGSEKMTNEYEEAMINLRMKVVKMEEKLECSVQKVCNTLHENRKAEEQKLADELQKLCALQDTFTELKDSLEKENLPNTSKAFKKYTLMNAKLHQLTTGLNEWNVTYTTVNVPELSISATFEEVVDTELKVEQNSEKTLGTKPQEPSENMGEKIEKDECENERWEEILKEDLKEDHEDGKPGGESKQEGLYRLPKNEKPVVSKTWALQKGVDVLTGVQKGFRLFHGIQKGLVKGIQKGFQAGVQKHPRKEAEKINTDVKKTFRIQALRWEEFAVKNKADIKGMASAGNGVLLIATQNQVTSYNTFPTPPQKIQDGPLPGSDTIDAVAVASSPHHNTKVIATLDCKRKSFTLHTLGNLHLHDQPLPKRTGNTMASSGPFLGFTYNVGARSNVGVYSIAQDENEITCKEEAQIPFKYGRIRSLSMSTLPDGRPMFIGACVFIPGKSEKYEIALVALTSGKEELWSLTFDDLDPNATNFDLRGVASDSENIFVLNNKLNVVYYISDGGKCVRTLSFLDTPPSFHFATSCHICLDWDKKSLFIASRSIVSRFTFA